jgi:hypothetical protein
MPSQSVPEVIAVKLCSEYAERSVVLGEGKSLSTHGVSNKPSPAKRED